MNIEIRKLNIGIKYGKHEDIDYKLIRLNGSKRLVRKQEKPTAL